VSSNLVALSAFAEQPKEPIELNSGADLKAPSIAVQGLGNKILDEASSAKYFVFMDDNVEYAYSFQRLGSNDVKWSGKPSDIQGLVFFVVTAYQDGVKLNSQLTTYRPSKYKNAIKLEKFDRNEKRPYSFDLGIDSESRLFGVNKVDDVTYLHKSDTIKKPKDPKEDNPLFY
jgi:hypothetical protein